MTQKELEPDLSFFQQWLGKEDVDHDLISPRVVQQMSGMLGRDAEPAIGEALPLPWHWIFFNPVPRASETGADGHPKKGGFLPPIPLPRRMWAGSRVECFGDLKVGETANRISRIEKVDAKEGRSGTLVFVTVTHEIFNTEGGLVLREEQDLVYKEASNIPYRSGEGVAHKLPDSASTSVVTPDPVLLFRYSAITFNGHRIHYDRNYAIQEEFYPALVVQGPLTASLLLNFIYTKNKNIRISKFQFRGVRPLFDTDSFTLALDETEGGLQLWALNNLGQVAMSMQVELEV